MILIGNGRPDKIFIPLELKTITLKNIAVLHPYLILLIYGLVLALIMGWGAQLWLVTEAFYIAIWATIGVAIGAVVTGVITGETIEEISSETIGGIIAGTIGAVIGGGEGWGLIIAFLGALVGAEKKAFYKPIKGVFQKSIENQFYRRGYNNRTIALYLLLTAATGILTGVGAVIGFSPYLLAGRGASAIPLTGMLAYPPIKRRQLFAQQRRRESSDHYLP